MGVTERVEAGEEVEDGASYRWLSLRIASRLSGSLWTS